MNLLEKRNSNYFELVIRKKVPNTPLHQSQELHSRRIPELSYLVKCQQWGNTRSAGYSKLCVHISTTGAAETIKESIFEHLLLEKLMRKCQWKNFFGNQKPQHTQKNTDNFKRALNHYILLKAIDLNRSPTTLTPSALPTYYLPCALIQEPDLLFWLSLLSVFCPAVPKFPSKLQASCLRLVLPCKESWFWYILINKKLSC